MTREIRWDARARKDVGGLDRSVAEQVASAIERLRSGVGDVRRLEDIVPPLYRLRVGDWRVLFRFERDVILIVRVLPRDKAYR
jgi:mRNA interferase RelE/StbE